MQAPNAHDIVLSDYAKAVIQFKARQLSRRRGFTKSDVEDLEQRLRLMLLSQADRFDCGRASLNTFIDRVVNTAAGMIVRESERLIRSAGQSVQSLETTGQGTDSECEPFRDAIATSDRARHRGAEVVDQQTRRQDEAAFDQAIGLMPSPLSDVCRHVMGGSISAAARELGTSRRRIQNALHEAKAYFERAGFGDS